jgi:hypothetical protein
MDLEAGDAKMVVEGLNIWRRNGKRVGAHHTIGKDRMELGWRIR